MPVAKGGFKRTSLVPVALTNAAHLLPWNITPCSSPLEDGLSLRYRRTFLHCLLECRMKIPQVADTKLALEREVEMLS